MRYNLQEIALIISVSKETILTGTNNNNTKTTISWMELAE